MRVLKEVNIEKNINVNIAKVFLLTNKKMLIEVGIII